jgi:2-keto-4-pentenoate hydratase
VDVNGAIVGSITRSIGDDALAAFDFLVGLSVARGLAIPAGSYITCGALSGIHDVTPGVESNVVFGGLAQFSVSFARRYPTT